MKRLLSLLVVLPIIAGCRSDRPDIDCFADSEDARISLAGELAAWSDAMAREDKVCGDPSRQCAFYVDMSDEKTIVFVRRAHVENGKDGAFCTYAIGDHGIYYYASDGAFVRYAAGE
jgi:hypothetical protein